MLIKFCFFVKNLSVPFTQEIIQLKHIDIHLIHFNDYNPADYLDHLTDQEKERYFTFTNHKRQCEFVATRILRHRIFGYEHIHYDNHGAPYIEDVGYISISHAKGVVGLAVSQKFKIGLDIEPQRKKAKLIHSKFLSKKEMLEFNTNSEEEMTKAWSAKEVLYKLAGRKMILFQNDLHITKDTDSNWKGKILNPTETIHVELYTFVHNDLIISINSSACIYES